MFYLYTLAIPAMITCCYFALQRPRSMNHIVNGGLILTLILSAYSCLLLLLEIQNILSTGWASYSVVVFPIPIFTILVVLKIILFLQKKKQQRRS